MTSCVVDATSRRSHMADRPIPRRDIRLAHALNVPPIGARARQAPKEVRDWLGASAAGDESHDHIGGVAVEVLASPVIHGGRPGIGVSGGDLDIP
jgi:hypothetical protein